MTYKTPSDSIDDEARARRTEELMRLVPELSTVECVSAVARWSSFFGLRTSMDDVSQGTFADFRTGLGLGNPGEFAHL